MTALVPATDGDGDDGNGQHPHHQRSSRSTTFDVGAALDALEESRRVEAQLLHSLSVVRTMREGNLNVVKKLQRICKHVEHKRMVAEGLEVYCHKDRLNVQALRQDGEGLG